MITPTHVTVNELRRQDLLATGARTRLIDSVAPAIPASRPRPLKVARANARYALACLAFGATLPN